jgi:hypothetical protein
MYINTYIYTCIYKYLHLGLLYVIANGNDDYGDAFKTAFDRFVLTFDVNDDIKSTSGGNSTRAVEGGNETPSLAEGMEGRYFYLNLYFYIYV